LHLKKTTETSTATAQSLQEYTRSRCICTQGIYDHISISLFDLRPFMSNISTHQCVVKRFLCRAEVRWFHVSRNGKTPSTTRYSQTHFSHLGEREKITNCHQTHTRPAAEMFSCTNQQIKPHSCTDRNRDHKVSVPLVSSTFCTAKVKK